MAVHRLWVLADNLEIGHIRRNRDGDRHPDNILGVFLERDGYREA
jgi:hypothetical protein